MATPEEQKAAFGEALRRHRGTLAMKDVAQRLSEQGFDVPVSTMSGWERGESTPRDRRVLLALDDVLFAEGELFRALELPYPKVQPASYIPPGSARRDIGELLLRRVRGDELNDTEQEMLDIIDSHEGGVHAVESALYTLIREVEQIRHDLDGRLSQIEHRLGLRRRLQAADAGNPPAYLKPGNPSSDVEPEPEGP